MAKLLCMTSLLQLAFLHTEALAQKPRWQIEMHAFRDQFSRHSGFEAAWGGGFKATRLLTNRYALFLGSGLGHAPQNIRFVHTQIETHTRFWEVHIGAQMRFALAPTTIFHSQVFFALAHLRPASFELTNGAFGSQRIAPQSENKVMPGFGMGLARQIFRQLALKIGLSVRLLSLRDPELFTANSANVLKPVWRMQAGLIYTF